LRTSFSRKSLYSERGFFRTQKPCKGVYVADSPTAATLHSDCWSSPVRYSKSCHPYQKSQVDNAYYHPFFIGAFIIMRIVFPFQLFFVNTEKLMDLQPRTSSQKRKQGLPKGSPCLHMIEKNKEDGSKEQWRRTTVPYMRITK
jgi:hypothetical protein